ncbi:MAG TPA: hypothetical protein ACFYD9_04190 [Candidatus Wunengus sp. YC64]
MEFPVEWQGDIYPAILKRKLFKVYKAMNSIQIFCDFLKRITVAVFIGTTDFFTLLTLMNK